MEEKVIIKSERYDVGKVIKIIFFVCLALLIISMLYEYITTYTAYVNHEHSESCYSYIRITCW